MDKYTKASQSGKAYYCNSISAFINDNPASIVGQLVRYSFEINKDQSDAWEKQIRELQKRLPDYNMEGNIIFEYDIVCLGKRVDVILLIRHMVFALEFKNGKNVFTADDAQQAENYAIDIKNFHKESENLYVCPILIATDAAPYSKAQSDGCYPDKQIILQRENIDTLVPKIYELSQKYGDDEEFDFQKWLDSPYYPTPTIISAAVEAYKSHNISEIARSEAGQDDINKCEEKINEVISYAKTNRKKCVCFVTGVPGAGKTLVGLDVVAKNQDIDGNKLSGYISGNGPLVDVLRKALANSVEAQKKMNRETTAAIDSFLIEKSFTFTKVNASQQCPPAQKILVFDEAQRVWNQNKMKSKHKDLAVSESHLLFSIMDRHEDWAVMICLVGLGQDIYDGEVGINEWFRCGIEDFTEWELFYSPDIFTQVEDKNVDIEMIQSCSRCHTMKELHLKTSIRSFRADKQCQFGDFLLDNSPEKAKEIYSLIADKYPVYITRDYSKAKKWLRKQVRGTQRCGVLACSNAKRLKSEGIFVLRDIDVENWFLAPSKDVRSSNMLEVVASEFKVQGLEIDWAIVCWDADLRRNADGTDWDYYAFRGTGWTHRNRSELQRYLLNSYRVLLTRARQGMVLFVPKGVDPEEDSTRNREYYDSIYHYLLSCGIEELP